MVIYVHKGLIRDVGTITCTGSAIQLTSTSSKCAAVFLIAATTPTSCLAGLVGANKQVIPVNATEGVTIPIDDPSKVYVIGENALVVRYAIVDSLGV